MVEYDEHEQKSAWKTIGTESNKKCMNMEITSIRYINMAKNWHRKLFIKLLLRSMRYKIFRSPGVTFDDKNSAYSKYMKHGFHPYLKSEDQKNRIRGVIGCWIAHSHALEDITEQNGITVVLEDDFVCQSHFFENALRMVNSFDRDFDIILFDAWGTGPVEIHKISENIYFPKRHSFPYYHGAHCLFVNNARITKILEAKLDSQVMDYDGFLLASGKLDTYIFYTGACTSIGIGSDITINKRLKYDLPGMLMCLLPYSLREKTAKFKRYFYAHTGVKNWRLSEKELRNFEGYYHYQKQKKINIRFCVLGDQLALLQPWGQPELLFQSISEVDFISQETLMPVKFTKDENVGVTMALFNNKDLWKKNNNYKEDRRKEIALSHETLKKFEGKYYCKQNDHIIQILTMDGHLLGKQLWLGTEAHFFAVSELEFRDRSYPLLPLRFIRDEYGDIKQIGVFFDLVIFNKI